MDMNLISTTDSIKGYEIVEQKGLVSSRVVVGVGFFQNFSLHLPIFLEGALKSWRTDWESCIWRLSIA